MMIANGAVTRPRRSAGGYYPPADRALFGFRHNATTPVAKGGGWCEHPFQANYRVTGIVTRAHLLLFARTL